MARKTTHKAPDRSEFIAQREKIKNPLNIKVHHQLKDKQQVILDTILDKNTQIVIIDGPAGTSKSWLAVLAGLQLLSKKDVTDIIYVRSAVESADSRLGFLKGDESEKLAPYMTPLHDKLDEFLPPAEIKMLEMDNRLDYKHLGFLRGLSWNLKYIIGDEAQNYSIKEFKTLMTRLGKRTKLVLIGDSGQNDIGAKSGFKKVFDMFYHEKHMEKGIFCFKLDKTDIVRSGIVQYVIEQFEENSL